MHSDLINLLEASRVCKGGLVRRDGAVGCCLDRSLRASVLIPFENLVAVPKHYCKGGRAPQHVDERSLWDAFKRHLYFIQGSAATYVFSLAAHQTYNRETTSQTRLKSAYIVVLGTNSTFHVIDRSNVCIARKERRPSI